MARFDACVVAYCLMGNHYHFVAQTRRANLSKVMHYIDGVYTQAFNKRHGKAGHLLQGRYRDMLVDGDAYLFNVCRYVDLNPVRAGIVAHPADWHWSSFRANVGLDRAPEWLETRTLLEGLMGTGLDRPGDERAAMRAYESFVLTPADTSAWKRDLRKGRFLGDESFEARAIALAGEGEREIGPRS